MQPVNGLLFSEKNNIKFLDELWKFCSQLSVLCRIPSTVRGGSNKQFQQCGAVIFGGIIYKEPAAVGKAPFSIPRNGMGKENCCG